MQFPHFTTRPEFRLALRITGTVLAVLIGVVLISAFFASITDKNRQEELFRIRQDLIQNRPGFLENIKKPVGMPMMGERGPNRRFAASAFRNTIVVSPDGHVDVLGPLENVTLSQGDLQNLSINRIEERTIGDESYALYTFSSGEKTVILYEPSELLQWPMMIILSSIIGGILIFSVLLFLVSLKIAREIIVPIEERAEKERSYARHIAHELKTPLSVIRSDLELALALPDETRERISSVMEEVDTMGSTVDDLLLLSVSEAGLLQHSVDIAKITTELIAKSPENMTWDIQNTGTPPLIDADERLLRTLLKNLIANVHAHAIPGTPATVRFESSGFTFENSTEDIPDTVRKWAFDPFVGTPGKGSGIGLSLVKRIAELHGWTVSFEAREGKVRLGVHY